MHLLGSRAMASPRLRVNKIVVGTAFFSVGVRNELHAHRFALIAFKTDFSQMVAWAWSSSPAHAPSCTPGVVQDADVDGGRSAGGKMHISFCQS